MTGILVTELERVYEFFEEKGLITLYSWELLSLHAVNAEIENTHPSLNLQEFYNVNEIAESSN